jgi:hypothetical protein
LFKAVAYYIVVLHTAATTKTKDLLLFKHPVFASLLLNSCKGRASFILFAFLFPSCAIFSKISCKPHDTVTLIYSENTTEEELQTKGE